MRMPWGGTLAAGVMVAFSHSVERCSFILLVKNGHRSSSDSRRLVTGRDSERESCESTSAVVSAERRTGLGSLLLDNGEGAPKKSAPDPFADCVVDGAGDPALRTAAETAV